jgi:hypothetical protein
VDGPKTGTVTGRHVLIEGLDSIGTREFTELLVHIVRAGTRVVAEPNTKILNLQGLLLVNLRIKWREPNKNRAKRYGQLPFRLPLERLQGTTT